MKIEQCPRRRTRILMAFRGHCWGVTAPWPQREETGYKKSTRCLGFFKVWKIPALIGLSRVVGWTEWSLFYLWKLQFYNRTLIIIKLCACSSILSKSLFLTINCFRPACTHGLIKYKNTTSKCRLYWKLQNCLATPYINLGGEEASHRETLDAKSLYR
jgi:hypothetical protein